MDEVAEMPASAQAMLLRFLDDGTYLRVGESVSRRADVRVVCATSRDLPALVEDGVFRSDLFFRVQGGCLRLPPLRERSDRVELARALLRAAAEAQGITRPIGLDATAEAWVLEHDWPGNVRELKSALAYALVMAPKGDISREDFPEPLVRALPADAGTASTTRQGALHRLAEDAVGKARGNISEAARNLGVARSTIYRMLGRPRR